VWSEADFLPGLIIDCYDDVWVIQTLTLALDQRKALLVSLLKELFDAKTVVERNDVPSRAYEGLLPQKGWLMGSGDSQRVVVMGKGRFAVDLLEGQKTGEYLDQIDNQMMVGALAKGRKVLDCFTYHGGFAIHAALNDAASVDAIDISEDAIAICRRNAELNGSIKVTWKSANVFDDLNARVKAKEIFDLVVLDPPSFTKSRAKLQEALRGYKEINLRAFQLLPPGGLLATFGCSHHVDAETFRAVVLDAAFDAHKILRLRRVFSQPEDHPVIPAIPETEYLKGYLFEVV
jgi:23S rRNA (cytosine1962-C5)-methyltransferase